MKNLKCFGVYQGETENCRNCEYRVSCQLYTITEGRMTQPLGGEDFDDSIMIPESSSTDPEKDDWNKLTATMTELEHFLNFLFHLDDYSLGIIAEIIAPSNISSSKLTVAEMARIHGISRQGMHRKILDMACRTPELTNLLKCVVMKIQKGRNKFRQGTCYRKRAFK